MTNQTRQIVAAFALCGVLGAGGVTLAAARSDAHAVGFEQINATVDVAHLPLIVYDTVYPLDADELQSVYIAVESEARGERIEGKKAVAQCILNACLMDGTRPPETLSEYQYASWATNISDSTKKAVQAVFDDGETVFGSDVIYFYAPERTSSEWHETLAFVCQIGGHRFFKEVKS